MRRGAGYLADAMKAAAGAVVGGAVALGKETKGILFGKTVVTNYLIPESIDTTERSGESLDTGYDLDVSNYGSVHIEKHMPGLFEKVGLWFGKTFGGDAGKIKAMVRDRGDAWDDNGVNIIAFRNDQNTSANKTYDDILVVVKNNEVLGAVMASTEPGLNGQLTMIEGQHEFVFQSQEERDELISAGNTGINDYDNDVFRPATFDSCFSIANKDSNYNGVIDTNEAADYRSTSGSLIHPGGATDTQVVNNISTGCQVIAENRFWDGKTNVLSHYTQGDGIGFTGYNNQKAYNSFLNKIGRYNQTIKYNIYNIRTAEINQMYQNYYHKLHDY